MGKVAAHSLLDQIHSLKRTLTEVAFYPPHAPRAYFGSKFKAVEDRLTKEDDLPCLVCGVRHSTLSDPKQNRFGAKQMEAHHRLIEWSLSNAVDPVKFNQRIRPYLHRVGRDDSFASQYTRDMSEQEIHDWIDHSTDNLWILCDVHHRGKLHGIHSITGPIWGPQDLLKDDFIAHVEQELRKVLADGGKRVSPTARVSAVGHRARRTAHQTRQGARHHRQRAGGARQAARRVSGSR